MNSHELISRNKLDNLVKSLVRNRTQVEEAADESMAHTIAANSTTYDSQLNQHEKLMNWLTNFKEKMSTLQHLVFNVHYELMHVRMNALDKLEKKLELMKKRRLMNERQPLMMTASESDYGYGIENGETRGGSSSKKKENLDNPTVYKDIIEMVNNCLHAVLSYVNCAATSFGWPFKLKPIYLDEDLNEEEENEERRRRESEHDIIQSDEKFSIDFFGMSRLGHFFSSIANTLRYFKPRNLY